MWSQTMPCRTMTAQAIRAILLTSTSEASRNGLRKNPAMSMMLSAAAGSQEEATSPALLATAEHLLAKDAVDLGLIPRTAPP